MTVQERLNEEISSMINREWSLGVWLIALGQEEIEDREVEKKGDSVSLSLMHPDVLKGNIRG